LQVFSLIISDITQNFTEGALMYCNMQRKRLQH